MSFIMLYLPIIIWSVVFTFLLSMVIYIFYKHYKHKDWNITDTDDNEGDQLEEIMKKYDDLIEKYC